MNIILLYILSTVRSLPLSQIEDHTLVQPDQKSPWSIQSINSLYRITSHLRKEGDRNTEWTTWDINIVYSHM